MFSRPLIPSWSVALAILVLYMVPGSELSSMSIWDLVGTDKLAHVAIFSVFTATLVTGLRKLNGSARANARAKSVAFSVAVGYGAILEILQGSILWGRTLDFFDFLANVLGALLGLMLFRLIYGPELSRG